MKKSVATNLLLILGTAGAIVADGDALAQSGSELAVRQELISRAEDARHEGKHAAALVHAKKAGAIKMTPSLRLFIAGEEEAAGAWADAFGSARQCVLEAERDPSLRNRSEILNDCHAIEAALEKRVGRVIIKTAEPVPDGLRVVIGGAELNRALYNTPYIVTPGKVTVEASAPRFMTATVELEIAEQQVLEHEVRLRAEPAVTCDADQTLDENGRCAVSCTGGRVSTADDRGHCCWPGQRWSGERRACAGPPSCPHGLVATAESCTAPDRGTSSPQPSKRSTPLFVSGAGALVAGAGLTLWLVSDAKFSTLEKACAQPGGCSNRTFDGSAGTIETLDAVSVTGLVIGGAALVGGLVWYLLEPPRVEGSANARVEPRLRRAGFLSGSF